jgi:transposase
MSKHDTSLKLKIVRQFLDQGVGIKKLGIEHRLAHSMIGRWIASYQLHGLAGLEPKYSAYDATFRLNVLRRKWLEDLSSNQVAAIFGIRHPGCINRWERQYHEGGMEALVPRPRGRPPMAKQKIPPFTDSTVPDAARSQEDLLRELEYLRAENAYLKKLDALIQSKKAAAQKKRS